MNVVRAGLTVLAAVLALSAPAAAIAVAKRAPRGRVQARTGR